MGRGAIGAACLAAALLVLPAASAGPGATTRVSVGPNTAQGNGRSFVPALSADGRYAAFYSDASNLVAGDTNGARDAFVRDLQTGETTRVSVSSSGGEANGDSFAPAISSDGRYVAFASSASNLVDGDTNDANDVFVRDRQSNTTARVSVGFDGGQANGGATSPRSAATGASSPSRSAASNIASGDANGNRDVFVYDRQTGTAASVSVDRAGAQARSRLVTPMLSANGRFVAFTSFADNLIPGDLNEGSDVFVRDLQANRRARERVHGRLRGRRRQLRPVDQRRRALRRVRLRRREPRRGRHERGLRRLRQRPAPRPSRRGERRRRAARRRTAPASGRRLSADGRYVAFYSEASNLVPGDTNGATRRLRPRPAERRDQARQRRQRGGGRRTATACGPRSAPTAGWSSSSPRRRTSSPGDTNGFTDIFLNDPQGTPPRRPRRRSNARCRA